MCMITDNQIFVSFEEIQGKLQYLHNMLLYILAKIRQYGVHIFFLTSSVAKFEWACIIKVTAHRYGEQYDMRKLWIWIGILIVAT